ncbi:SH3 domain-containing protein [Elioraea sp.]|uniref:SH3 domain-containing protein n=1 Tax=Elioraea sp. TaxID=2185103 RepID=UPI003F71CC52
MVLVLALLLPGVAVAETRHLPVPPLMPERPPPAPMVEAPAQAPGSVTGRPVPRFASLRASEINLRAGPGTRFPVEWTYTRAGLPVEIVREFDTWRRIRDMDGVEGWVQQARLAARRTFLARGGPQTLRRAPDDSAPAVAQVLPGVLGTIRRCEAASAWCEVSVPGARGFLRRAAMWGVYPGEEVR